MAGYACGHGSDGDELTQWQAALVVLAWLAAAAGIAALVLKRKDV